MILLLAIAGVSLSANAVSWWNSRRTAKANQQIDALEARLDKIHAADAKARRVLLGEYVQQLGSLIDQELQIRNGIATELTSCHAKARGILKKRFGSHEHGSFLQVVLELELAMSRINAERTYLELLRESLSAVAEGNQAEIPSLAALQLPNDFPREGGLVHFDGEVPRQIHGYRLNVEDWCDELDGRAMIFDVDHRKKTARVTTVGAALLEANLLDGGGAISAKVICRHREGIQLDYLGTSLLLPCNGSQDFGWMIPEANVEVYPEIWTLDEITRRSSNRDLLVRAHPRIGGSKKFWSPILLSVSEAMLPKLVEAYRRIDGSDVSEAPWRIHLMDAGQIAFTLGLVTFVTSADSNQKAFSLSDVLFGEVDPAVSVRFQANLSAFVPGTADDSEADRSLFIPFVQAIHAELGTQKQMLLQQRAAVRLRKLSLIYQDQQEYLQATGSCGFLPGEVHRGGRIVFGTIVDNDPPAWVGQAVSAGKDTRLRVIGHDCVWEVRCASWINQKLGICRLELDVPLEATQREVKPFELNRIELAGEGSQQQTLSKALEYAILGKFKSARVHSTLLGLAGDVVKNRHRGRAPVERLLNSDEAVVAIWGPPGTGKTTLLVKWLVSLFKPGDEANWPSVLIAAPTHVAVTKLLTDLLSKAGKLSVEAVRYGGAKHIEGTDLEPLWHRRLLAGLKRESNEDESSQESWERWKALLATREGRASAAHWLLSPRHIHAATCVGMARRDFGLWDRPFDIAIVDEAGKAFGAELMIPASVARKVVLVGDHNQLPPTVTMEALDEDIGYRLPLSEVEELLRRNMFHEIFEQLPATSKGMLTKQYRMHKDIGDIVGELFYDGHLKSDRSGEGWTLTTKRLVFVDFTKVRSYRHCQSQSSESIENPTERTALRAMLSSLRLKAQAQELNPSVLVVCPYAAQRNAVKDELCDLNSDFNVRVTTVDAVQGGEADIVILLMTRNRGRVQFLLDRHRLNVALSRARDAVIILGHLHCLARNEEGPVAELIKVGRRNGTLDLVQLPVRGSFKEDIAARVTGMLPLARIIHEATN